MQHSRLLALAASLAPVAAFTFTGPSTDDALDLSNPITISWEAGSSSSDTADYETFNLYWFGATGEDNSQFSYILAENVTNEDGEFEWDPVPYLEANQESDETHGFSEERDYYFHAQFSQGEGGSGTGKSSDRYEIENYDVSAAGRAVVAPLMVMAGVVPVLFSLL